MPQFMVNESTHKVKKKKCFIVKIIFSLFNEQRSYFFSTNIIYLWVT